MATFLAAIRTTLFCLVFYVGSLAWVLSAMAIAPFSQDALIRIAKSWARFHRACSRWLLGQRIVIEGTIPTRPVLVVMKHEAMFETIDLLCLLDRPVIAAKRELLDIPLWGRVAENYGLLPIDREAGASALRNLRRSGRAALDSGRPICLFPEGTRVPPGEQPPLKSGFAGLYKLLGVPVVAVAVTTGRLVPRHGFIRHPGVVRYRFAAPIPPGLPRAEAERLVHAAINALNN